MENIKIALKNNTEITLSFSMYFFSRCSELLGAGLQESMLRLLGEWENDNVVKGGLLDDLHTRYIVISAGVEAFNRANGDYTKPSKEESLIYGEQVCELIPNAIVNPIWADIFGVMSKSLVADNMPKEEANAKPKKAMKKS